MHLPSFIVLLYMVNTELLYSIVLEHNYSFRRFNKANYSHEVLNFFLAGNIEYSGWYAIWKKLSDDSKFQLIWIKLSVISQDVSCATEYYTYMYNVQMIYSLKYREVHTYIEQKKIVHKVTILKFELSMFEHSTELPTI